MNTENQPDTDSGLEAVDFFCGIGGMTKGFEGKGIEVKCGIDIDQECEATYEAINDATFLNKDVTDWPVENLADDHGVKRNNDDMIFIGCSPCQYWSKINTDKTKSEDKAFLLDSFQDFVDEYKPGYLVIENVPGLKSNAEESKLEFLNYLNDSEYAFDDGAKMLKEYGVPQKRNRYLLIASRNHDEGELQIPEDDRDYPIYVKDFIGEENKFDHEFESIEAGHTDESEIKHTAAGLSDDNLKYIKALDGPGADRSDLSKQERKEHGKACHENGGFKDVYARMWWDQPAPTLTTRFNSFSNGRFGHPEQHRAISLREGAVLQTFDYDDPLKSDNKATTARQIGNAFPPEAAKTIANYLIFIR